VLLLSALQHALLEEILVIGYLLSRLRLLGVSPAAAVAIGAVFRGSYHLYQGFGAFIGNAIMVSSSGCCPCAGGERTR
jgi:uncharacterized protein